MVFYSSPEGTNRDCSCPRVAGIPEFYNKEAQEKKYFDYKLILFHCLKRKRVSDFTKNICSLTSRCNYGSGRSFGKFVLTRLVLLTTCAGLTAIKHLRRDIRRDGKHKRLAATH